jgi:hypothetical protein
MANNREVAEGMQFQGEDEIIAYTLDVTAVGSSPTSVSVVVKTADTGQNVTATVMPVNTPTVQNNVITLSPLKLLTNGQDYKVEVKYVIAGNTLESYFYVRCQE